jgi:hypothetical protein
LSKKRWRAWTDVQKHPSRVRWLSTCRFTLKLMNDHLMLALEMGLVSRWPQFQQLV